MNLILIILIVLLLCGTGFGYHGGYLNGPYWGGGIGTLILVLIVLAVLGVI